MKDIQITSWCDLCFDMNPDAPRQTATDRAAASIVVDSEDRSGRALLYDLDLCENHAKELTELARTIRRLGVPQEGPEAVLSVAPGDRPASYLKMRPCPICDKAMTASGVVKHIWDVHLRVARAPQSPVCPECKEVFASPVGCGRHRASVHGYDPVEEAVAIYQDGERRRG